MASAHALPFAELLRRHRLAAGLSQEELAARAGLSRSGVSALERGIKCAPHKDTVTRLADALRLEAHQRAELGVAAGGARVSGRAHAFTIPLGPSGTASGGTSGGRNMTPLVGREREAALLDRQLRGDGPPLLIFAGEPGIGKSRLLAEASARATVGGWRVVAGGCQRRSAQESYAPLAEALARYVASRTVAQLRADTREASWLARLLPELAEKTAPLQPAWAPPPEQERRLMFAAVRRFLANIAGLAGTLLVLDDMQWAGADALDLLADVVRHCVDQLNDATARLRIVAAYRDTEVGAGSPLVLLLTDLDRESLLTHAELSTLAPDACADLLDGIVARDACVDTAMETAVDAFTDAFTGTSPLPASVRAELVRRADGVPLFLVSGARALLAGEGHGPRGGEHDALSGRHTEWRVPWTVAQSIQARLAALDEATRELLGVAAVVGRVSALELLLAVARRPEDEVLRALEAACAVKLLVEVGTDYQFTHDLIRDVTLGELSAARKRSIHRRVAQALVSLPDKARERHVAEIMYHLLEAGEGEWALPYALLAGDHAARVFAYDEAERYYRLALDLARTHGDTAQEAAAALKLAGVVSLLTRYSEALE